MSRTRSPERSPVGIPILAVGHRDHHRRICPGSVVAPLCPFAIRGCFPAFPHSAPARHVQRPVSSIQWSGKTGYPRPACQRAAAKRAGFPLAPRPSCADFLRVCDVLVNSAFLQGFSAVGADSVPLVQVFCCFPVQQLLVSWSPRELGKVAPFVGRAGGCDRDWVSHPSPGLRSFLRPNVHSSQDTCRPRALNSVDNSGSVTLSFQPHYHAGKLFRRYVDNFSARLYRPVDNSLRVRSGFREFRESPNAGALGKPRHKLHDS